VNVPKALLLIGHPSARIGQRIGSSRNRKQRKGWPAPLLFRQEREYCPRWCVCHNVRGQQALVRSSSEHLQRKLVKRAVGDNGQSGLGRDHTRHRANHRRIESCLCSCVSPSLSQRSQNRFNLFSNLTASRQV